MTGSLDPNVEFAVQEGASSGAGNRWDRIVLGDFVFELTKVLISGPGRGHKFNKKTATGTSGRVSQYQGTKATEFTISWLLWAETHKGQKLEHFTRWDKLSKIIAPAAAKQQPAKLKIQHPILAGLNVSGNLFHVDNVQPPEDAGNQIVKVTIEVAEAMDLATASTVKPPQKNSGEAVDQARARYNELAGQKALTENPLTQSQLQNQMDDIAKRYPVIGPPKPSKTATKP